MKTYLLIDSNHVDLFIHERVLRLSGIDQVETFNTLPQAWDFLKNNYATKATVLLDIKTAMREECHQMMNLKEYVGELEVYVLYIIINEADKKKFSNYNSIKGFVEKPFTIDKLKRILED